MDGPVLLVGMDGLEWNVLLPLLHAGEMPVFERLIREGVAGRLETLTPTSSPVIWTTVATGKLPAKHGILQLAKYDEWGEIERSYLSTDRATKALWNIFTDEGRTVHSVGWWMTYPVEEISGVMVPQMNVFYKFDGEGRGQLTDPYKSPLPALSWPPEYRQRMIQTAVGVHSSMGRITQEIFGQFKYPHTVMGGRAAEGIAWAVGLDAMHLRLARGVLAGEEPFDLMLVYLRGTDVTAHAFWRWMHPDDYGDRPIDLEIENYAGVIPDYYRYMDRALGSILDEAGPGVTVVLLSDHGMESAHTEDNFTIGTESARMHSGGHDDAPPGVFIAAGPRIRPGAGQDLRLEGLTPEDLPVVGGVADVAPTILALKGLPLGSDMDGRVLDSILVPGFLQAHPPTFVKSHDTAEWLAERQGYELPSDEDRERLEELRSLGYIE